MEYDIQALAERIRRVGWSPAVESFSADLPEPSALAVIRDISYHFGGWVLAVGPASFDHLLITHDLFGGASPGLAHFRRQLTVPATLEREALTHATTWRFPAAGGHFATLPSTP